VARPDGGTPDGREGIRLDTSRVPERGVFLDLEHDSRTLVVAFAGLKGFLGGVAAFEFGNALASVEVKSAFLRDHFAAWYHRGVIEIGPDIDSVAATLRDLQAGVERMVLTGNSAGGYAALLFGALLGCEAYAFSPQTFVDRELLWAAGDHRWDEELEALIESGRFDHRYGDLAPVLASSSGRFQVWYGALEKVDEKHVERVSGLEQVTVNRIENCDHRVVRHLRDSGWLGSFLRGMTDEQPAASG